METHAQAQSRCAVPGSPIVHPSPAERIPLLFQEEHLAGGAIYGPLGSQGRLYLVRSGWVRLLRAGASGAPFVADLAGPGSVFGDLGYPLLGGVAESAVAGSKVRLTRAETAHLQSTCAAYPRFGEDLIAGLAGSLQRERLRVQAFASRDVPAQLAMTLLRLGEEVGEPCSHGGAVDLRHIRQEDIADLIGASRSFISTLINEMKRWGWLASAGRVLCLHDLGALRKAAFDDE